MTNRKVISSVRLPSRMPIAFTVAMIALNRSYNLDGWQLSVSTTVMIIAWILWITKWMTQIVHDPYDN